MAERRMFAKTIIDSDAFLDMPLSAQALYFHLSMRADDDGFINNPKKIQRMVGCGDDDAKLLIAKSFLIPFDSGVVVIKHWKIHNYIRSDRYKPTVYKEEKAALELKENGAYTIGIPTVYQMETQDRLGKVRLELGEDRIEELSDSKNPPPPPGKEEKPKKHKYGEYSNVLLTDQELEKLKEEYPDWAARIERLSSYIASTGKRYKSHYATIRNWASRDGAAGRSTQPGRKEPVPDWIDKPKASPIAMAAVQKMLAEENPELSARVEALKERINSG